MAMDKSLLKSYIVRYDGKQSRLADAMGISLSCLNAKINEKNGAEFRQSEIDFISQRYNLTCEETCAIFFIKLVSKIDTSLKDN